MNTVVVFSGEEEFTVVWNEEEGRYYLAREGRILGAGSQEELRSMLLEMVPEEVAEVVLLGAKGGL